MHIRVDIQMVVILYFSKQFKMCYACRMKVQREVESSSLTSSFFSSKQQWQENLEGLHGSAAIKGLKPHGPTARSIPLVIISLIAFQHQPSQSTSRAVFHQYILWQEADGLQMRSQMPYNSLMYFVWGCRDSLYT